MSVLKSTPLWRVMTILSVITMLTMFASCGEDNPAAPPGNRAPTVPAIDAAAGAPADDAIDVALAAELHWTCTDPDGDALSFTVSFGTDPAPGVVSADQAGSSYTPASLANSTTYYWQITAKDAPGGATTASPVWSFTTADAGGNEPPAIPEIDIASGAPADTAIDVPLSASLHWTCTDPDGDALSYTVHFGTAPAPPIVSTDQAGNSYTPTSLANATTYYWQITAKDSPAGDTTSGPVWSFTTAAATGPETVSTPLMPSGSNLGDVGQSITYYGLGAASSHGHAIQYRFDWGDLTMSNWSADTSIQKSWAAAGTFGVKSQARCSLHTEIESGWSPARMVVILDLETVSTPDAPTGPASGDAKVSLTYSTTGAVSSRSHALEYRFGWGFNAMSNWSTALEASHDWFNVGSYEVTVQARCQEHPDVESEWSVATPVEIVEPGEIVEVPMHPVGPDAGATGVDQIFIINYPGSSNLGHPVEHQFDWNDGEMSGWTAPLEGTHAWALAGNYDVIVRARCIEHPTAISDWSSGEPIEITDAAEVLTTPRIDLFSNVVAYRSALFYVQGATSNFGDPLEYRMDWGADGISDWQDTGNFPHVFETSGLKGVAGQARCKLHPEVISEWSALKELNVAEGNSYIQTLTWTPGYVLEEITFTSGVSVNSEGHLVEYRFRWDTSETPSTWGTSLTRTHVYDSPGTKAVTVESRCIEHPSVGAASARQLLYLTWRPTDETITIPGKPVGPATGAPNTPITFSTTESVSSKGHVVEYRFVAMRSGTTSVETDWSLSTIQELTFTLLGGHGVWAYARCSIHPEAFSTRSVDAYITIQN